MKEFDEALFTQDKIDVAGIRRAIDCLDSILKEIDQLDNNAKIELYILVKKLSIARKNLISEFIFRDGQENLENRYALLKLELPNAGDWGLRIDNAIYLLLDGFEFTGLTIEQREDYIRALAFVSGEIFYSESHGYYHFGIYKSNDSEEMTFLSDAIEKGRTLSLEEIDRIYEYEKRVLKIHISVPEEFRVTLLKKILLLKSEMRSKKKNLFKEHKMKSNFDQDSASDFVLYLEGDNFEDLSQNKEEMIARLSDILESFSLPESEIIPRFSVQAVRDGKAINGLSYTHGNGNFKAYILRQLGQETLDKYYDPKSNWALRND